jgi:hypothetical protein
MESSLGADLMLHPWFPKLKTYQNLDMVAARGRAGPPAQRFFWKPEASPVRPMGCLCGTVIGNSLLSGKLSSLIRALN